MTEGKNMRKVVVTGANGFIGSTLIRKMIDHHIQVIATDMTFSPSKLPESEYIKKYSLSLSEIDKLRELLEKNDYDTFYHFAWRGVNGKEKADPSVQIENIDMTLNCAKLAYESGCKKFLCAGTIAEQAISSLDSLIKTNGGMMYGVAKHCTQLMLETYCKNVGLNYVWMQFSNIYGPQNKTGNLVSYTLEEILNNREATFGPALQIYDFIYIDDLINAVYRLGENETGADNYFIGSGSPKILKDYLYQIGTICGKSELIKIGLRPDDGIKYSAEMFDNSKLISDIGEYVSVTFEEGIKRTLDNF